MCMYPRSSGKYCNPMAHVACLHNLHFFVDFNMAKLLKVHFTAECLAALLSAAVNQDAAHVLCSATSCKE